MNFFDTILDVLFGEESKNTKNNPVRIKSNCHLSNKDHTYKCIILKESSCTEKGVMSICCTKCGHIYKSFDIDATGHQCQSWNTLIEPTDRLRGLKIGTCNICNAKSIQIIEKSKY